MGSAMFDIYTLIAIAISAAIFLPPFARIVRRAGYSGWWALLMIVPGVNVIALWVFAFIRWPALEPSSAPR
jgi:uncharacterized membrane protein YhaH (DUF805 family)